MSRILRLHCSPLSSPPPQLGQQTCVGSGLALPGPYFTPGHLAAYSFHCILGWKFDWCHLLTHSPAPRVPRRASTKLKGKGLPGPSTNSRAPPNTLGLWTKPICGPRQGHNGVTPARTHCLWPLGEECPWAYTLLSLC